MGLFCHVFFYVILWKGNVERLNLNRPYYQSRGGGGSKKEKKEGGKKGEGTPSSLSYSPPGPPAPHPLRLVLGVYYDHEKFKMFNTRIVNYRVRRFVFMPTLNSHWLDEKEERKSHHM